MKADPLTQRLSKIALVMLLACCAESLGCRSEEKPETPPGDDAATVPAVEKSPDEIRAEMQKFEPWSEPFEAERLKLLVAWEEIRQREGMDGFVEAADPPPDQAASQSAHVDPKTKKIAWVAMVCYNPDCTGKGKGGGPLLVTRPFSHLQAGPDGQLIIGPADMTELDRPFPCPACGERHFMQAYEPPASVVRRRELMAELKESSNVYRAALKARKPMPTDVRSPAEINKELAQLPKLFLVEQE